MLKLALNTTATLPIRRRARFMLGALLALLVSATAAAQEAAGVARAFRVAHTDTILADFRDLLRIPNVASNLEDMQDNARFIQSYIERRGFSYRAVTAGGAPYIIAERAGSPSAPSVLIYAHFDGQPVIPEDWASPPFEPTLWNGMPGEPDAVILSFEQESYDPEWRIAARAAGDDKAPVIALMAAIDALQAAGQMPDVTIKLILDGEEEIGSPTLAGILEQVSEDLAADVLLFCDGPMHQSRRRQLTLGVRGSMTVDLKTFGPNRPLHSGHYGNWAPNPNEILMRLLLSMKDDLGNVVVEGFLEDATPLTAAERSAVDAMPVIDDGIRRELGLGSNEIPGERVEAAVMRPAIVVKGLYGGGIGAQSRNIIESSAEASLNIRLVPGQTPERVAEQLTAHFQKLGMQVGDEPPGAGVQRERYVQMTVRPGGYRSFRTPISAPVVSQLKAIMDRLGGDETLVTPTMGGSLPIYLFEDMLDMPIVILPIANHDNNQHGRNENLRLQNLFDAIELYAEILDGLATPR